MGISITAFELSGLARKLNTGRILLKQHAYLGKQWVKPPQTFMQVAKTDTTRKTTRKTYTTFRDPTYGFKVTGILIFDYFLEYIQIPKILIILTGPSLGAK